MLDAFGKNGDMGSALLHFESMIEKDVVSWTSVINGFARSKQFTKAIWVFEKMIDFLVKPNEATYVNVLSCCANLEGGGGLYQGKQIHGYIIRNEVVMTVFMGTALIDFYGKKGCLETSMRVFNQMLVREACARTKKVELGSEFSQSMSCQYGIVPIMEHYGCMVDLLGRAGLLTEATELTRTIPFQPDTSVLGALLGACKIHGAFELGNEVARRLLELQPRYCGLYIALSSINADKERCDRAADLRKAMVEAGIRKIPAYSLIGYV
ncbi:hypothetical protein CRYUN_Cryun34aG0007200 [Craigia yunnanensis]